MTDNRNVHPSPAPDRPGRLRAWVERRERDDRGATLVEAAFVMPIFVLLIFGIFEFSGYVGAATGANAAVKAGARMATVMGDDPMADRNILNRMSREGAGLVASHDVVEEIKIWHASSPDEEPPTNCNAANDCNLYTDPNQTDGAYSKAALPLTTDTSPPQPMDADHADCYFGYGTGIAPTTDCSDTSTRLDSGWPTDDRRILEKSPFHTGSCTDDECDPTDLVGIYISVRHDYYTGLFGDSVTVEAKTIARIEPQGYDDR